MLIDSTYFISELLVPGLSNTVDGGAVNLNRFIAKYEPVYLQKLLGIDLYDAFIAGLLVDPVDSKWANLQNALIDSTLKISPIANYAYFYYSRNNVTQSSGVGEVKGQSENATSVYTLDKQVFAWNEMVKLNKEIIKFIKANSSDYPEYKACNNFRFEDVFDEYNVFNWYYPVHFCELFTVINTFNW